MAAGLTSGRRPGAEARRRWLAGREREIRRRVEMRRGAGMCGTAGVAVSQVQRDKVLLGFSLGWAVSKVQICIQRPYPIFKKIKKTDTPKIRIHGVSDTYPYPIHDTRVQPSIRAT